MSEQLSLFSEKETTTNLLQDDFKEDYQKLKELALSCDNENIAICCTLLGAIYNYSVIQQAMFVMRCKLESIKEENFTQAVAGDDRYNTSIKFNLLGLGIEIFEGTFFYQLHLVLLVNEADEHLIHDYLKCEDKYIHPTPKVRDLQLRKIETILLYYLIYK